MMRIFTFIAVMLFMSFCKSFAGTYSDGTGTVGDPYQISTTADLIELSNTAEDWGLHFILTQDIAFNANEQLVDWDGDGTADWDAEDQLGFSPIGNSTTQFTGTFDGQGFEIDNLYINRPSQNYIGLFGKVFGDSAIIENLGVINVVVTNGDGYYFVGGLVGRNDGSTVSNCYSTGSVSGYYYVGGLVGYNYSGTVSNSYSTGSVSGGSRFGGLVGENDSGTISNCYSTGTVDGISYVGGLVGHNHSGTISNSYSTDNVTGNNQVGGLVGVNNGGEISNCYSTGTVDGISYVGGLVGYNNEGTVSNCYSTGTETGSVYVGGLVAYNSGTISNSYSTGTVTGSGYVGGLVGYNDSGTLSNCYSTGSVSGVVSVGGLVGFNNVGIVTNSFWDIVTSGQTTSSGGTGKTTAEMKDIATYTDYTDGSDGLELPVWDFVCNPNDDVEDDDDWQIYLSFNNGYPFLSWQNFEIAVEPPQDGDVYQISTAEHLYWLSQNPSAWSEDFVLLNDIDMSISQYWDCGLGFFPIGNNSTKFTGTFDGQGFEIDNLFINRTSQTWVGLFGFVSGFSAIIENLGVTNVVITGSDYVGGLVGSNSEGTVNNCYSTGSVTGYYYVGGFVGENTEGAISNCYFNGSVDGSVQVGGLVGYNYIGTINNCYSTGSVSGGSSFGGLVGENYSGAINNCYSTGTVTGNSVMGGLLGFNSGTISNCYSTGTVTGNNSVMGGLVGQNYGGTVINSYSSCSVSGYSIIGGLVGINDPGTVSNCYSTGNVEGDIYLGGLVGVKWGGTVSNSFWDTETSGRTNSAGGTGKTTAEMKDIATYTDENTVGLDEAWDFKGTPNDDAGTDDFWNICATINDGYPYLTWQTNEISIEPTQVSGVYQISTVEHLHWLSQTPSAWSEDFVLLNDIDMSISEDWDCGLGFSPIGNTTTNFTGTFDGQGFEIDNLFINRPSQDFVGLFGRIYETSAIIENLGVTNAVITGSNYVGGLVGFNHSGTVSNCYSTGSVTGNNIMGGLVGRNNEGTVSNCYSTGSVDGISYVGGLVGENTEGAISNCYSTGIVIGEDYVGGLVGRNIEGTISNCYSTGSVTGSGVMGGLLGVNYGGTVSNSYSTGFVSGNGEDSFVGGLVGRNYIGTISNCYSTCSVEGEYIVGGLVGVNYSGTVSNCYSSGSVEGEYFPRGLVGYNNSGTVNNSFWDMETSDQDYSEGGTGKTTIQMKNVATFTAIPNAGLSAPVWDFVGNPFDDENNDDIWNIHSAINNGYPYFEWRFPCQDEVWVSDLFNNSTSGWQVTHFENLEDAIIFTCDGATVNITNYTHEGNVDMTGYNFIIGDGDFNLDGVLSGGLIQTPSTGRLILPAVQNVQQDYPMGDGNNNYTLKIIPMNAPTNPILVRLFEQSVPGAIQDPMLFWEIEGDEGLNATIIFRIDKSAIAPKTLNTNSILRFFDGEDYVPMTEEQVTINDMGTYYEIIIINVNQF